MSYLEEFEWLRGPGMASVRAELRRALCSTSTEFALRYAKGDGWVADLNNALFVFSASDPKPREDRAA